MASNYIIAILAEEHDKALIKSLLATFGDRGDNQWAFTEDMSNADVVVVDFESHAQKLPLRGAKHGHIVVAYSQQAPSNPPTPFMLPKPVRGRDFVKLLERMEDVLTAHDEDEFAKTQRRIVF
ncbi:MAG TPA: hypothetical protein PLF28_06735 [Agitococcus sp.]|uniref:hypothetical protein n=1 Tax=uncultured Agitococcus sp. TaxID=1506599 RepID=UPI0026244755|nr:hypothetical protein [uncultured Agitococcus sp.]HMY27682.1 hypothetical protein [Agitococcus sp.]HMY82835.1 hypothetical protein [Agitococcus sp.]HNA20294.1 hypothetical protein [Agitococcus sp.]HNA20299.1 hypothetical protein [Agitococcus sp.]HNB19810.1 hypothetical protein [Agitococcus sp.]